MTPQETYKPPQHHAEFAGSDVIRFVINGEEGIRLSDASGGNWAGFEGRDDRSLFGGDRLQIIIRLHVRHSTSVRHRLVSLTLTSSPLGVHAGNQR